MRDGLYFLYPEGSGWIAAIFKDGQLQKTMYQCDQGMHQSANDDWANCFPRDHDKEVLNDREIIRQVMGNETSPAMVIVTRSVI